MNKKLKIGYTGMDMEISGCILFDLVGNYFPFLHFFFITCFLFEMLNHQNCFTIHLRKFYVSIYMYLSCFWFCFSLNSFLKNLAWVPYYYSFLLMSESRLI